MRFTGFLLVAGIVCDKTDELLRGLQAKGLQPANEVGQGVVPAVSTRSVPGSVAQAESYVSYVGAAMCSPESIKQWNCTHCQRLGSNVIFHSLVQDTKHDTLAYIATDNVRQELVLSFRGTYSIKNWIQDLDMLQTDFPGVKAARVHAGFKKNADGLAVLYLPLVQRLLQQPDYQNHTVVVAGHSLGGAMAVLAALHLQQSLGLPWSRLAVYTYGQPRLGNEHFVNYVNSLPLAMTRVVNENDLVPHLPPLSFGYLHHHTEMYTDHGATRLCRSPLAEDPTCSRSRGGNLSYEAHKVAFGVRIGKGACQ